MALESFSGKPTKASALAAGIRAEILSGRVTPGSRLELAGLAERHGVSRGPLREAASRLASEGLLTFEDQRGFRVAPISRADLLDLTRTRKRVELWALTESIEHGDVAWEGRVWSACHVLDRVTDHDGSDDGRAEFAARHDAFHAVLAEACPSTYVRGFRERLYALTQRYRNLAADRAGAAARDVRAEHRAIAEAAVARRADEAADRLAEHLDETARVLIDGYPELFAEEVPR